MDLISNIRGMIEPTGFDVGVAIRYIEHGIELHLNADRPYHLASVVKIPIMVETFRQIEVEGILSLEERVELRDNFKLSGTGVLKFMDEGLSLTIQDLITLMIIISDNTATDTLLERLGGPLKVDATMKSLGLRDIHTKMTIRQAHWDRGMRREPLVNPREAAKAWGEMQLVYESACFTASPEGNSASPRAMNNLLCRIFGGEIWSRRACNSMMDIMYKQQRRMRIPSKLPRGSLVAHKTGTITGAANDAGIIEISEGNHCALTVFVRDEAFLKARDPSIAADNAGEADSLIGDIALAVYEHGRALSP
jgi:beta-lactamase class A